MLGLLALLAATAAPVDPGKGFMPTTAQAAAIADATKRGRDIYDFDQAAWVSTDTMLAAIPGATGVRGWIVDRAGDEVLATYYGLSDDAPFKIYVAHVRDRRVINDHVFTDKEDRSLSEQEKRLVVDQRSITQDARSAIHMTNCGPDPINHVVLPPSVPNATATVYFLSPQRTMTTYPLGGHYRFDVDAAGKVVGARRFSNGCIDFDSTRSGPTGGKPVMATITHLLDLQPTEIHVWMSLVMGLPIAVLTTQNGELWLVNHGEIHPMQILAH